VNADAGLVVAGIDAHYTLTRKGWSEQADTAVPSQAIAPGVRPSYLARVLAGILRDEEQRARDGSASSRAGQRVAVDRQVAPRQEQAIVATADMAEALLRSNAETPAPGRELLDQLIDVAIRWDIARVAAVYEEITGSRLLPETIRQYLNSGYIFSPAFRAGGSPLWTPRLIREWIDTRPGQGRPRLPRRRPVT